MALARAADFQASPVLVADRRSRFFDLNLLDATQLDAMVVWVQVGPKDYYLDPAVRYCPFKLLPWYETATKGVRADELGVITSTPVPDSSDAVIERKALLQMENDGSLEGQLKVTFVGQEALNRRLEANEKDDTARRKMLEDEVKGWLPAGSAVNLIEPGNWESSEESLSVEFKVKILNIATSTGRRILLPLGVFQASEKHPLSRATRVHPVYFHYPWQELDDVSVQLPNGYQVESLPKSQKSVPGSAARYEISPESHAGVLQLRRHFAMQGFLFAVEDYPGLRKFYDDVRAADEQQVVLRAVEARQQK